MNDAEAVLIGPFAGDTYRLTVGGFEVPHVEARLGQGGVVHLTLDRRYGLDVTLDELERWGWWVANAMAVAAGYSCFGENSAPRNRFASRLIPLGGVPGHED